MDYIIDGCNFIKKFEGGAPSDFEGEKEVFTDRLKRYASARQVRITVVFDSSVPSFEESGGIRVIHAPDADEKIVSEAGKLKHPASARVVTDDRALRGAVRRKGADFIGVLQFEVFLSKMLKEGRGKSPGRFEKPSPEDMSEEDIRHWQDYFKNKRN